MTDSARAAALGAALVLCAGWASAAAAEDDENAAVQALMLKTGPLPVAAAPRGEETAATVRACNAPQAVVCVAPGYGEAWVRMKGPVPKAMPMHNLQAHPGKDTPLVPMDPMRKDGPHEPAAPGAPSER